jgi:hypothetical protein
MDKIEKLLEATCERGSENRQTVESVKGRLAEYIEMREEDVSFSK